MTSPRPSRSAPRPIGAGAGDSHADGSAAIPIASSAPHGAWGQTGSTTFHQRYTAGADEAGTLSRSFAHAGSFIAGHSAFGRQAGGSGPAWSSMGRASLEGYQGMSRQGSIGGPFLGLEPGLGLTTPLLEQQHRQPHERSPRVTGEPHAGAAGTPSSLATAGSDAARLLESGDAAALADSEAAPSPTAAAAAGSAAQAKRAAAAARRLQNDVLYGLINAIVGIPTMISFAAIVYQDPLYKPLLGQLARVSFFSAAMHQLVFTLCSSLPFAVGQPQDVGLIFLSAMATSVADLGRAAGQEPAEIVGTAMLTLTIATTLVGVLTWLVAKFKLATLVQYVPLPVVGGYLGYVGYFCLAAGIGLGTDTTIDTFSSWTALLTRDALLKFTPTIVAALVLWVCMTRARNPWALPVTLAAVPAAFHLWLLVTGTTLAQAQDAGWVLKPQGKATQQFWELYELFHIEDWHMDGVYWAAIVRQAPKMLGLFFVVTFGSCLDVAAIQADMPFPIDFNAELATVGLSNIIVGLSGSGYTGSYIFSQTIFSMRAGVSSMWHGLIIFALEAAIFLLPFSVVQYLPNFFFGALLTVFGIEIAGDWLVRSYAKVTRAEYVLLLATFVAIMELELEAGVATGIVLCVLYFASTYARANMAAVTVLPTRSAAVRSYLESHVLDALSPTRLATVALSGYLFFGSSVAMSDRVIQLGEDMLTAAAADARATAKAGAADGSDGVGSDPDGLQDLRLASLAVTGQPQVGGLGVVGQLDPERLALLEKTAPAFVILDFRRVLGVDATAAQTMASLALVLRRMGIELVLTRVRQPTIRRLLVAHGIISQADAARGAAPPQRSSSGSTGGQPPPARGAGGDEESPLLADEQPDEEPLGCCRAFATLNEGATYAEDRLLEMAQAAGLLQDSLTGLSLQQFFAMHCSQLLLTSLNVDVSKITQEVAKLGVERTLAAGQRVFSFGDVPDEFYLILKGVVAIEVKALSTPHASRPLPAQLDVNEIERSFASGQGAVIGITDFVLRRRRSFQADATSDVTLLQISRAALDVMVTEVPEVATALQAILLRDACLSEVYAYEVHERSAAA